MRRLSRLLVLLWIPFLVATAKATIIVATSSSGGCAPPPGSNVCPVPAFNGGLIVNGNFADAKFTGFSGTLTQNTDPTQGGIASSDSVSYYAYLASAGTEQTLYQTFATTPGQSYLISFTLGYRGGGQPPSSPTYDFAATFGDQTLLTFNNLTYTGGYRNITYNYTAVADTTSTTLLFTARNDPGAFDLTNIAVVTPEPASVLLLATGALGLFGFGWFRMRSSPAVSQNRSALGRFSSAAALER